MPRTHALPAAKKRVKGLRLSRDELVVLARRTQANTEAALAELRRELRRMAGKCVHGDGVIDGAAGSQWDAAWRRQFSLSEADIREELEYERRRTKAERKRIKYGLR